MKTFLFLLLFALVSCSTTPQKKIEKLPEDVVENNDEKKERSIASIHTKIRFFETQVDKNELPTELNCDRGTCRYLEIEISNDLLNIRRCSISENSLYWKVDAAKALLVENLNSKCKNLLVDYDVTTQVVESIKEQMLKDKINRRDPYELARSGGSTVIGAIGTIVMGTLTVVSAIDPVIPLFVITGPGTYMYASATYTSGKDFISEAKGQPKVIYKSGSAEQILKAIEKDGVSAFLIASPKGGGTKRTMEDWGLSKNDYDRYQKSWKNYTKYLKSLQQDKK